MRTAIISGTFDPITVGHYDVIVRACSLFDRVVVAVSYNTEKKGLLPDSVRVESVKAAVSTLPNVIVEECTGLLAEFCSRYENPVIVRGARSGSDFDYERSLFIINKGLGVPETVILPSESSMEHISSTYVRELIKYGKDYGDMIPDGACETIDGYLKSV